MTTRKRKRRLMRFRSKIMKISNCVNGRRRQVIPFLLLGVAMVFFIEIRTHLYPTEDGRLLVTSPQQTEQGSTTTEKPGLGNTAKERFKSLKTRKMLDAMKRASREFDVPFELLVGIANAESSLGTSFQFRYDHNCHNWWGIKKLRSDGSHLRCFLSEEAGARTAAKLLRNHYFDEGYVTLEDICRKWIGNQFSEMNCPHWIRNVIQDYAYSNDAD
jgi:hypothetical protein